MSNKKSVSVTQLAWFAADPDGFVKYKGGARNEQAVRKGDIAHQQLGRSPYGAIVALLLLFSAIGLIYFLQD